MEPRREIISVLPHSLLEGGFAGRLIQAGEPPTPVLIAGGLRICRKWKPTLGKTIRLNYIMVVHSCNYSHGSLAGVASEISFMEITSDD